MKKKRVAITGMGIFSPLGQNLEQTWQSIIKNKSITKRNNFMSSKYSNAIHRNSYKNLINPNFRLIYVNDNFKHAKGLPKRYIPKFAEFAFKAFSEAFTLANFPKDLNPFDVAVIVGSGFGDIQNMCDASIKLTQNGKISPYLIPSSLHNTAATEISLALGSKGPLLSISSACATGSQCIGTAFDLIQSGRSKVAICGASDATAECPSIHGGFASCKALSRNFKACPEQASRPFDIQRDGFVLSEGAGILVIEDYSLAKSRGAQIFAEILSYSTNSDAYHITSPDPTGKTASIAIATAMSSTKFNLTLDEISFISAHASSTLLGDRAECNSLKSFFGTKISKVPIYSAKGSLGHTMGACGAIEIILGVKNLIEKKVPATTNLIKTENSQEFNFVIGTPRKINAGCFLSNSFGFGGHNSCLIIGSPAFCNYKYSI